MTNKFFIIIVEDVDNTQRALIHEAIKREAEDWWHQMDDVWVVRGKQLPSQWRDLIMPFVPLAPSCVIVLALPEGKRAWAVHMPNSKLRAAWLHEKYYGGDDEV